MHYIDHGPAPDFLAGNPNEFDKIFRDWRHMLEVEKSCDEEHLPLRKKIKDLRRQLAQRFGPGPNSGQSDGRKGKARQNSRSRRGEKDQSSGNRDRSMEVICGYCEIKTNTPGPFKREIDHFRPRNHPHDNRYEHLTFSWENLFYVCARCNKAKENKFPHRIGGYISPAEDNCRDYFEYDITSCKIRVNRRFMDDDATKERIERTIKDFNLNCAKLLSERSKLKNRINKALEKVEKQRLGLELEQERKRKKIKTFTGETRQFSSFVEAYRDHLGLRAQTS